MDEVMEAITGNLNWFYKLNSTQIEDAIGAPEDMSNYQIREHAQAGTIDGITAAMFLFTRSICGINATSISEFLKGLEEIGEHPMRGSFYSSDPFDRAIAVFEAEAYGRVIRQTLSTVAHCTNT